MKKIVIAFILATGLLIPSWFCAILWRDNDSGDRPQVLMNVLELVLQPLFSSEAWLAGEQLDFWSYWIPAYFFFIIGSFCVYKFWEILYARLNNGSNPK
jgi:hypothetical protein